MLQDGPQPLAGVEQLQGQVVLRGPLVHVQEAVAIIPGAEGRLGAVLEAEGHLHDGAPAGVALRTQGLHQALEGDVLVGVGPQAGLPHPGQELAEGAPGEVEAQGEGIDEAADQVARLRPLPSRHRRPHQEVGLPGVAVEQDGVGRQEGHVQGGPFSLAEGLEGACEGGRQEHALARPAEGLRPPGGGGRGALPAPEAPHAGELSQ